MKIDGVKFSFELEFKEPIQDTLPSSLDETRKIFDFLVLRGMETINPLSDEEFSLFMEIIMDQIKKIQLTTNEVTRPGSKIKGEEHILCPPERTAILHTLKTCKSLTA